MGQYVYFLIGFMLAGALMPLAHYKTAQLDGHSWHPMWYVLAMLIGAGWPFGIPACIAFYYGSKLVPKEESDD